MIRRWARLPVNAWLEPLLALAVAVALAYDIWFLLTIHYLPQPFFYDPSDTWMDWFNSAYWSHDRGKYEIWGSVYPPLTFVFIQLFSIPTCYGPGSFETLRYCDWVGIATLHGTFLINIILISIVFMKLDRKTALPRAFAASAGLPMLFALERGNVFLVCVACMLIAFGPLVKSARVRWVALALAINFKIYLVTTLFATLLQRRWRWFEGGVVATVLVYMITYAILREGSPYEIYLSISTEAIFEGITLNDVWFSTTYKPLIGVLNGQNPPIIALLGSDWVEYGVAVLPMLTLIAQATILLGFAATWLRPEAVPRHRLVSVAMALAIITTETSGYSPALVIIFIFMERWEGIGRKWAIFWSYIFCIPADIVIDHVGVLPLFSFLGDRNVMVEYFLMLGPFLRPLVLMSLPFALSCVTIRAVWIDIRQQGWKERWRYRRDLPIMVGEGAARPPARVASSSE